MSPPEAGRRPRGSVLCLARRGAGRRPASLGLSGDGPALQKMQDDDTANPAMLFVQAGAATWAEQVGAAGKSCADCHGDATVSMRGVAARYPAVDAASGQAGRSGAQDKSLPHDSSAGAGAGSGRQRSPGSQRLRHAAVPRPADRPARRSDTRCRACPGADLYKRRQGQLDLSCANCHDDNAGRKLAGATIPQAHPTGYPIYRLEWQALGSLKRRLRNCIVGMRAEPWQLGAPEYLALEAYLMDRARGMLLDAPGVRP